MKFLPRKSFLIPFAVIVAGVLWYSSRTAPGDYSKEVLLGSVRKGDLTITAVENGNVRAKNSLSIRSDISLESGVKILSIVPEGYFVTPEDVAQGKVLLELDPTSLQERMIQQKSDLRESDASLTEAGENYSIQVSQNESSLKAARQTARFALLDFKKYLGKETTEKILQELALPMDDISFQSYEERITRQALASNQEMPESMKERIQRAEPKAESAAEEAEGTTVIPANVKEPIGDLASTGQLPSEPASKVNFLSYLEGGEQAEEGDAAQTYRSLKDELLVSQNGLAVATENFDGSQRLFDRGFITKTSLEQEKLSLEKTRLSVKSAETALVLFRDYELPKAAEKYLADYEEALRGMERCVKENRAKLAQVGAKWITARQQHQIKEDRYQQTGAELEGCTVRASVPGLVAYGTAQEKRWFDSSDPIAEGSTVRYRQTILTIPDMSSMMLDVDIPEARIKLVRRGMPAVVQVDAEPDKALRAVVSEVAVLPDSANARFTSTKIYPVSLEVEGVRSWLKPGMSAKVEILSEQLKGVIYAPIQSVNRDGEEFVCFVPRMGGWEKRKVEIGPSNDQFIEIKKGLDEGESVALSVPPGESLKAEKRESNFEGVKAVGAPSAPSASDGMPARSEAEGGGPPKEGGSQRGGERRGPRPSGGGKPPKA